MLLAELEVWHSRPAQPTRRLALGHLVLPIEPSPGFGGLLLAAVVAQHCLDVPPQRRIDVVGLLGAVCAGERIVQPRVTYRYQVDRHGLARTRHRLVGEGDQVHFDLGEGSAPVAQVLAAVYALERLDPAERPRIAAVIERALRWRGPVGPAFVAAITGERAAIESLGRSRAWALRILGFEAATEPSAREVSRRFRQRLRTVHPDLGGDRHVAAREIEDLDQARRILSG